jgi:hypothetical protein
MTPEFKELNLHHLKSHKTLLRRSPFLLSCLKFFWIATARRSFSRLVFWRRSPFLLSRAEAHVADSHSPIFFAAPILEKISESENRLINGSELLIDSVNRFHFDCLLYPDTPA